MRRREFMTILGGAVAVWPLAARGQQPERMRRIGVLIGAADSPDIQVLVEAFLQVLAQLGWTDGRNLRIDYRSGGGDSDAIRKHATELVALVPDVIFTVGSSTMGPLLQATSTVPIVFAIVPDPVGSGFVKSLSRPGGNATGFVQFEYSLSGKWPELLKEIAPGTTRVAVLWDPTVPAGIGQFAIIQAVAPSVGLELSPVNVRDATDIERDIADIRTLGQWRHYRDGERVGGHSSRPDRRVGGPAQATRGLQQPHLCCRRRPDLLWDRFYRPVPPGRRLRRSHP